LQGILLRENCVFVVDFIVRADKPESFYLVKADNFHQKDDSIFKGLNPNKNHFCLSLFYGHGLGK